MLAKLSPPNASRLLVRPRLHRRLDEARGAVTWLVAPAGAGKTSLLATWAATLDQPPAWLRLDAGDRDPAALIDWFVQMLPHPRRHRLPAPCRQHLSALAPFAREFFRAWYQEAAPAATLVIENLHEVDCAEDGQTSGQTAPCLLPLLCALLAEKTPAFTVLVSSRTDPGADLVDPAGAGQGRLILSDLKCRIDETQALAAHLGLEPTSSALAELAELAARADGWMAGLGILLRQDGAGAASRQLAATDAQIFEAFAGSAFDALPRTARELLLRQAFLPVIRADRDDDSLSAPQVASTLDTLWRGQFFLERQQRSRQRTDYACHPMLQAFLQEQARRRWTSAELAGLWHDQAARCARDGDPDLAIDLYLRAGLLDAASLDAATRLVIDEAGALFESGQLALLQQRIDRLGDAERRSGLSPSPDRQATLDYWRGLCLQPSSPARSLDYLRRAHAGHLAAGDPLAALLAACAALDGCVALWQGWTESLPWVDEASRLLDLVDLDDVDASTRLRIVASGQSVMSLRPEHPLVARLWRHAARLMQTSTEASHRLAIAPLLIGHARWRGDFDAMRTASRQALSAVDASPALPRSLPALLWIGIAAAADGHACEPERRGMFERLLTLSRQLGRPTFDFHCRVNRAQESLYLEDIDQAENAHAQALRCFSGASGAAGLLRSADLARLVLRHDWEQIVQRIERDRGDDPDPGGVMLDHHVIQLLLAQAHAVLGRFDAAEAALAPTLSFVQAGPAAGLRWQAALVRAHIALARHREGEGRDQLRFAFGTARRCGYRHVHYWWMPAFHLPLFVHALQADIEVDWLRRLIIDQRIAAPAPGITHWPYRARIRALGRFDLEVAGKPLPATSRSQPRVLALLRAIAAQGGRSLAIEALSADLWPDSDGDAAMSALDITILRARRLLGDPATLVIHDGRIGFNPALVDLDLWRWQHLLDRVDATLLETDIDGACLARLARQIDAGACRSLLDGEAEEPWLHRERRHWAMRFAHRATRLERFASLVTRASPAPGGGMSLDPA